MAAIDENRAKNYTMQGYDFVTDYPADEVNETRDFSRIIWYTEPRHVPTP